MRSYNRDLHKWIWLLLLIPFSVFASPPASLTAMQIQPSPVSTRITFSLSKQTTGKVKYFSSLKHLVIVFENTVKHFTVNQAKLAGSNVESFSSNDATPNKVIIIFTVKDKVKWKTEYVPDPKQKGVKLQLDILSPGAKSAPNNKVVSPVPAVIKPSAAKKPRIYTIVIDAGHGGKDTGAIGPSGIREKNIVLGISKKLAALINRSKNMRAVLTRDGDYFITLRQRLKLARKGEADLFVAVHADAHYNKQARGVSIYTLSQHGATTEAARWLADNDKYLELDDVEFNALQDRSRVLRSVLIDMAQTVTIQDSVRLGSNLLSALKKVTSLHYRRVERAPFVVLKSPDIPSVLIETGFVSNPKEEKKLIDPTYQQTVAQAIYKGLQQYKIH